ncbi:unnamed protein product, partial [Cuscuta epithymum]
MSHIASRLSTLKLILLEELLVYLVSISLPSQFNQFKVSCNCIKEKWSLNELISHCVQEEEKIKQDKTENAHLASTSKGSKKRNIKEAVNSGPRRKHHKESKEQTKESKCFFAKGLITTKGIALSTTPDLRKRVVRAAKNQLMVKDTVMSVMSNELKLR